jgi:hypothetical protein
MPAHERMTGSKPFEMTPFMRFLRSRLDELKPMLRRRVDLRVALHRHPGVPGIMEAAEDILRAVPGIEIVDLHQPAVGLMSNYLRALPDYKRKLQLDELEAARAAQVDALVAVYHPDHRELCAHERDLLAHHRVKEDAARQSIQAMIAEQPLPLTNLGLGDAPRPGGTPADR